MLKYGPCPKVLSCICLMRLRHTISIISNERCYWIYSNVLWKVLIPQKFSLCICDKQYKKGLYNTSVRSGMPVAILDISNFYVVVSDVTSLVLKHWFMKLVLGIKKSYQGTYRRVLTISVSSGTFMGERI